MRNSRRECAYVLQINILAGIDSGSDTATRSNCEIFQLGRIASIYVCPARCVIRAENARMCSRSTYWLASTAAATLPLEATVKFSNLAGSPPYTCVPQDA